MQSMAEECFELTFSSKVCEATNTISDEPTPKLDSAIETMCRKTGEVMRQLVKHEILQKWGVLWVPRWNISSCITNKITSPNQPNIWMPLCNNVFWHFFRGWGVIIGDSLAISRQSNCRQLSHFAICRQSKCRQSINRLSTFLPPRKVKEIEVKVILLLHNWGSGKVRKRFKSDRKYQGILFNIIWNQWHLHSAAPNNLLDVTKNENMKIKFDS